MVKVVGPNQSLVMVRAFLDMGSQMSCVTESLVQHLELRRRPLNGGCTGIGNTPVNLHGMVKLSILSWDGSHAFSVNAAIIKRVTRDLPTVAVDATKWPHLSTIQLADPDYGTPGPISILLGAEIMGSLMENGFINGNLDSPHAMRTKLGWILFGSISKQRSMAMQPDATVASALAEAHPYNDSDALDSSIRRLWELQEPLQFTKLTPEEEDCESLFNSTHHRDKLGRYVVRIPCKQDPSTLGSSRQLAMQHFYRMEKRLAQNELIRRPYIDFMEKYESLGHMRKAIGPPKDNNRAYYITHHAVLEKFRVVFNASLPTNNGVSLNDIQMAGPTLQKTLWQLIMCFRLYRIALSADVEKMFRMIRIHDDDLDLQRIFWRAKPTDRLDEYQLLTVTYGMKSASYNAVKAMIQCGLDHAPVYPRAAKAIRDSFYMDDFLACYDTVDEAIEMRQEIDTVLKDGGFILRKWRSNDWNVLNDCVNVDHGEMSLEEEQIASVLGLKWQVNLDSFQFNVCSLSPTSKQYTKRTMASEVCKVFDPTGFLSPVTIVGKILMQQLWLIKCDWDKPIPQKVQSEWTAHRQQLTALNQIKIPRWIGIRLNQPVELHYFCDASQLAYAAVCYIRSKSTDGSYIIRLLTSKAKVAPLKTISIPRLELCAAEMAALLHVDTDYIAK